MDQEEEERLVKFVRKIVPPIEEKGRLGKVKGPMSFFQGVGWCGLFIYLHAEQAEENGSSIKGTLIHELAHVGKTYARK